MIEVEETGRPRRSSGRAWRPICVARRVWSATCSAA